MTALTIPPIAVVMGVAGSGKSAVGGRLADRLDVPYIDGDDLHPQANIDKMSAGHPLDDEDREPWLIIIGKWLHDHRETGAIATCSALKRSYRDLLRDACPGVPFIHLAGSPDLIVARVSGREGHFMPTSLVDSQFDTLEPLGLDEPGITLDVTGPVDGLADQAASWLAGHRPTTTRN
ncbi:gluconokinase [Acidipropionibacterium virtanenii]|uniref:Gluconokinase n=1 Tax=Acidipropionibacterium virtanenii TaxID=2057246 RepID=A0A344UVB3_9ACTN|nr:gluconokinase [Acidipropionibacterium virtanenii]AXE39211.1 Thermoresistant gluconokinase [Acidipropionibacterium virtanenii]